MDVENIDILFYTAQIQNGLAVFTEKEMRHAVRVLRKRVGDELAFTDGRGTIYAGRIVEIREKEVVLEIMDSSVQPRSECQIIIAVAPTKNFSRMEWCIGKLTEMGVQRIIPLLCEKSERVKWNASRALKVAVSAMKQSKQAWLPECTEPMEFAQILRMSTPETRYIALQGTESVAAIGHYRQGSDVLILIGPEGDFTKTEVSSAIQAGFVRLNLGTTRLRTETAAMVAMATINALNQK